MSNEDLKKGPGAAGPNGGSDEAAADGSEPKSEKSGGYRRLQVDIEPGGVLERRFEQLKRITGLDHNTEVLKHAILVAQGQAAREARRAGMEDLLGGGPE
jgi:hypothetical protein